MLLRRPRKSTEILPYRPFTVLSHAFPATSLDSSDAPSQGEGRVISYHRTRLVLCDVCVSRIFAGRVALNHVPIRVQIYLRDPNDFEIELNFREQKRNRRVKTPGLITAPLDSRSRAQNVIMRNTNGNFGLPFRHSVPHLQQVQKKLTKAMELVQKGLHATIETRPAA
jgi:hypothetical protein